jgi:uncharacterized phiE125 gp8 family phage protein
METNLVSITGYEPVTVKQAKEFCAIDHDQHDEMIKQLITAARERAERYCSLSFIKKEYQVKLEGWPGQIEGTDIYGVRIKNGPLLSVEKVEYYDASNTLQELSSDMIEFSRWHTPAILYLVGSLPTISSTKRTPVLISYTAGYDDYDDENSGFNPLPDTVRTAIMMMVRTMYDHRADLAAGVQITQIPVTSEYMLDDYRIRNI